MSACFVYAYAYFFFALGAALGVCFVGAAERKRFEELFTKGFFNTNEGLTDKVLGIGAGRGLVAEVAREHDTTQVLDNVNDGLFVGEVLIGISEEDLSRRVVLGDGRNYFIKVFVEHERLFRLNEDYFDVGFYPNVLEGFIQGASSNNAKKTGEEPWVHCSGMFDFLERNLSQYGGCLFRVVRTLKCGGVEQFAFGQCS